MEPTAAPGSSSILLMESTALHLGYIRLQRHWLRTVVEQILEAISKNFWRVYIRISIQSQHFWRIYTKFKSQPYEFPPNWNFNIVEIWGWNFPNPEFDKDFKSLPYGLQKSAIRNSKVRSTECATCNDDDLFENSRYCWNSQKDRRSCINPIWGYGVATISKLLKIVGLFCRISSLL